jgi:photosystem II protein
MHPALRGRAPTVGRPGTAATPTRHRPPPIFLSPAARPLLSRPRPVAVDATSIQFIRGITEPSVPDVKLTRSRDGSSGVATFVFTEPAVFDASSDMGDITGLYLVDDEGELTTVDVQAKFVNGKPDRIEAKYVMRTAFEWDRFMRFMERYAEENELGFAKQYGD